MAQIKMLRKISFIPNVSKLFEMVGKTSNQISYYDSGVGTQSMVRFIERILGLVWGVGMSRNIRDCYKFVAKHYKEGDHLNFFGFSRGATTVRSLSSFIHLFGIIKGVDDNHLDKLIREAYSIYEVRNHKKRQMQVDKFRKKHMNFPPEKIVIETIGVWDTVAALRPLKRAWKVIRH